MVAACDRRLSAASDTGGLLSAAERLLSAAGCDTPRLDAELLVADALGASREELLVDRRRPLAPAAERAAWQRLERRAAREPVAYILGRRAFRWLELSVDRRVLIPRPESEDLVEVALDLPPGARVHDVGTGSGAVALAVKHERPDLVVSASDWSPAALEVARGNAAALGLEVSFSLARDLPHAPAGHDLVVANLPYVGDDEWVSLAPEIVRWEPREALVAGPDGLEAIRALLASAASGTRLALEHAPAQAGAVRAMLANPVSRRGLDGRERVTVGLVP